MIDRTEVAERDRRRELAQQIVDRHSPGVRERVWRECIHGLRLPHKAALACLKMRGSLPEQLAELLEPGELDRMMGNSLESP